MAALISLFLMINDGKIATGSVFAMTIGRNGGKRFIIKDTERLFHMFIAGQTGTGKSTLMFNMMHQDLTRSKGFCLVDPHGDLARKVANRADRDLIYWDAADPTSGYGYNPLTHVSAPHRPLVASGLIETFKKQWSDAWGARMEHLLRFALLALLERRHSSLRDVLPLFLDKEFRKEVVSGISDEQVRHFWTVEYSKLRYQMTNDGVAPIANKIGSFLANPVVRKALCEPAIPLRFRKLMDEGTPLVVNLAKGRLGSDTANLLGGIIVSTFAHAALSRQHLAEHERHPYFLYVDEFHSFTTAAFADMLSELRKYGMGLVLSTQFASQLDEEVRESVFGNVGTLIVFRVGARDAALLTKQLGGIDVPSVRDLVRLGNHEMFVRFMVDGAPTRPFSAQSLPPD